MFGNYFKVAIRNIMKNRLYSLLNIIGLAIGLVGAILILLYSYNELTYDSYHKNADRIMRIGSHFVISGQDDRFAAGSFSIAPLFKEEYPEVEEFARFTNIGQLMLVNQDKRIYESLCYFGNQGILKVFTHEFIYGSSKGALEGVNKVIISESLAKKLFGNVNPLDKTITTGRSAIYKISGVFKDFPDNTHLKYNALFSDDTFISNRKNAGVAETVNIQNLQLLWQVNQMNYILLKENANQEAFLVKTKGFYKKYMEAMGKTFGATFEPIMQPLKETHFQKLMWDVPQGSREYIYIFLIVGLFLLSIACINYMNLSTARSAGRAKEVGLRKVVGAQKSQLVRQFLFESVVVALIAMVLAVILTELVLPTFNQLTDKKIDFGMNTPWWLYLGILGVTVLVGIISGSYPAFYLSSFQPAVVIKGEVTKGVKGRLIRQILVVFQFSLSIIMIIGTLVVTKQLNFLRTHDLGYNKDNILVLSTAPDSLYDKKYTAFRNEALKQTGILDMATASNMPVGEQGKQVFSFEHKGKVSNVGFNFMFVDAHFLDFLGLKFVEGKNFETQDKIHTLGLANIGQRGGNSKLFIVNKSLAVAMGYPGNALGQAFYPTGETDKIGSKIVGVVNDFNYSSLRSLIEPMVFMPNDAPLGTIFVRFDPVNMKANISSLETVWKKYFSIVPFEYVFLNDEIQKQYQNEEKLARVFTYFAFMCIFIACLGLLGLATFAAQQRTKEIGIRKVLGGSIASIVILLTKDFSKLVLVSNLIAWPVTYYLINLWLKRFPYHIDMPVFSFLLAAVSAFVIAWVTVGVIAFKTAASNPVTALRYE